MSYASDHLIPLGELLADRAGDWPTMTGRPLKEGS